MESQPQNPEFSANPENFHPCKSVKQFNCLYDKYHNLMSWPISFII